MITPTELMSKIDQMAMWLGNGYNNNILEEIQNFESQIRQDQKEKFSCLIDKVMSGDLDIEYVKKLIMEADQ